MAIKTKKHPSYPDYLFYSDGRIQNKRKFVPHPKAKIGLIPNYLYNKFIPTHINSAHGTLVSAITDKDMVQRTIHVARITGILFVKKTAKQKKEKYLNIWFKDGDKHNVDHTNLFWLTRSEYEKINGVVIKRIATRKKNKNAKLHKKK